MGSGSRGLLKTYGTVHHQGGERNHWPQGTKG